MAPLKTLNRYQGDSVEGDASPVGLRARHQQVVRVLTLARELSASRRGLSLKVIAERHGWPLRTVYRDIDVLEAAGFPIAREDGRFRLPPDFLRSAKSELSPEERLSLWLARALATGLNSTELARSLESVHRKLTVPQTGSGDLLAPPLPITIAAGPLANVPSKNIVNALERGIAERLVVACAYRALSTGELTTREIEPGELYWDPKLETLYVIAWCRLRQDVRVFAAHRFLEASVTRQRFDARREVTSQSAFRDALRLWRSQNVQRVVVDVRGLAARSLAERPIHRTQKLETLSGGIVRLRIEVAGLDEIQRWILAHAPEAIARAPESLVLGVHAKLSDAAKQHADVLPLAGKPKAHHHLSDLLATKRRANRSR